MFPLRDHNPSQSTPWVTYGLMAANIGVFLSYANLFADPAAIQSFFVTWGLLPADALARPTTVVTSMFLHGGILHLAGNMLFLWIFGDNMEDEMGGWKFLLFYLAAGAGAAALQIAADPESMIPMVGASGAIAGVMGGYLLLFPKARVDILFIFVFIFKIIPVPAWVMLGLWFGLQIFNGANAVSGTGGVAYWAHAGGFVAGFLLTLPLWQRKGGRAFWATNEGHPPHPEARYRTRRTDIPRVTRK